MSLNELAPAVLSCHGDVMCISSIADLDAGLDRLEATPEAEVWLNCPDGPAICVLRNRNDAVLLYLARQGDAGCTSIGQAGRSGTVQFRLANGQVDEYPGS